jgi:hypothetical protein
MAHAPVVLAVVLAVARLEIKTGGILHTGIKILIVMLMLNHIKVIKASKHPT